MMAPRIPRVIIVVAVRAALRAIGDLSIESKVLGGGCAPRRDAGAGAGGGCQSDCSFCFCAGAAWGGGAL